MRDPAGPRQPTVSYARIPTTASSAAPRHGSWHVQAQIGDRLTLLPGQMYFGGRAASLRTLLGSCVAITLWHPEKRIGGMCHFLLPSRKRQAGDRLDGRYGDEAVHAMLQMLKLTGTSASDYHAHLYGGADTMPEGGNLKFNVGERNIEQGWSLIDQHGFQLQGVDVGEDIPRTVTLTLASGAVDMRRGNGHAPSFASQRDQAPQTAPMTLNTMPAPLATAPMPLDFPRQAPSKTGLRRS